MPQENTGKEIKCSAETFCNILYEKELSDVAFKVLEYLESQNEEGRITKKKDLKEVIKNTQSRKISTNRKWSALDALEYYKAIDFQQEGTLYIYRITKVGKMMKTILETKLERGM